MAEQPRGELKNYVGKPEADGTPPDVYMRVGYGFTSLAGAMNPQTDTITYINDVSSTTTTGFEPEWPIDGNIYTGDPANDYLHKLAWDMAKGDDAMLYFIEAMMWDEGAAPGTYRARRFKANWAPGSAGGGAGGEKNTFSGTIQGKGDPVFGVIEFEVDAVTGWETCTFTPDP
jgi:hypothetical protein